MSEDVEDRFDDLAGTETVSRGRSVVDRINQRAAKGRKPLYLRIPRWEGDVIVRCQTVSEKKLKAAMAARRNGNTALIANLLVAACEEVLVLDDDGQKVPAWETRIGGDGNPAPIRYDGRLADLFLADVSGADSPARIAILMYRDNTAMAAHVQKVFAWQTGESLDELDDDEVDELAGEAEAAT